MPSEQSGDDVSHVMVDIETMGLKPGSAILSVGACRFDSGGAALDRFYCEIDIYSCFDAGLKVDEDTREWWQDQPDDVRPDGDTDIGDALSSLSEWFDKRPYAGVWANSPSFDLDILAAAYEAVDLSEPWDYWETRDVRTVRSLPCAVELEMDGREHHALDDAVHQAREVAATLEVIEDVD